MKTAPYKIKVLMVTGVYFPEKNGAVLQCMQLICSLKKLASFSVLTGSNKNADRSNDYIDGVLVTRVLLPSQRKITYFIGLVNFLFCLISSVKKSDVVHIHGFSKRNAFVVAISLILKKGVILKMTSFGQDDPLSIKNSFFLWWFFFKRCRAYIGICPAFLLAYKESGLPFKKYNFIPNCVDINKFSPVSKVEKNKLKTKQGYLLTDQIILFIGHFSHEKRPMLAYETWLSLRKSNNNIKIILIGHTKEGFEVDYRVAENIKRDALGRGIFSSINFVEETQHIDEFMKIADVFVLPSTREGLPNVLLEAMASALPCIVSNLPGVTDWLIDDGVTGVLVDSNSPDDWACKIRPFLRNSTVSCLIGLKARDFVKTNFSLASVSSSVMSLYRKSL
ncbi:RfaG Glycosyltransferase [Methylophilaceae bacterium]